MGNILAIRISPDQPLEPNPYNLTVRSGLVPFLAVATIYAHVQTTTFVGNSLYMIHYDCGQFTTEDAFKNFLKTYFNTTRDFAQLVVPPRSLSPRLYLSSQPPSPPPQGEETHVILDAGYEPVLGFWVTFVGNYFLTFHKIFRDWPQGGTIRTGPDFKGFQPSKNNPRKP
jgi:hypothetical protein